MENSTNTMLSGSNIIKVVLLVYFVNVLFHTDLNQPDKSFILVGVAVLIFLIGLLLRSLFIKYSHIVMKICAVLSLIVFYLAVGAWVLGYSGEGGQVNDFEPGSKVLYDIQCRTPLNIPVSVDYVLPIEHLGMKYLSSHNKELMNEKSIGYKYGMSMKFEINRKNALLPKRVFIIYRAFKILPMINVIDLRWPSYSK